MGSYKVFDGTNWIDICDCAVNVYHPTDGWTAIDPSNCPVKYFDGTTWCPVDCGPVPCNCPEGYTFNPANGLCERVIVQTATPSSGSTQYRIAKHPGNEQFGISRARLYSSTNVLSNPPTYPVSCYADSVLGYIAKDNGGNVVNFQSSPVTNAVFNGNGVPRGRLNQCGITVASLLVLTTGVPFPPDRNEYQFPCLSSEFDECGLWTSDYPNNTFFTITFCITITEEKEYIVGFAADNEAAIDIVSTTFNGGGTTNVFNLFTSSNPSGSPIGLTIASPFRIWHMFPITLPIGTHTFVIKCKSYQTDMCIGAEIYNANYSEMLTFVNTSIFMDPSGNPPYNYNDSPIYPYIIASTRQLATTPFLQYAPPGTTVTWSCPSGTELNTCYGVPSCISIQTTPCN
jgi:hypothetical protein